MLTITTAVYAGSVYHSSINIVLNIIPTLYEGYTAVSYTHLTLPTNREV